MSFDASLAGTTLPPVAFEYGRREVILYALGVGAGIDELELVSEHAPGGLKVLPSFGVLPVGISRAWLESVGFDLTRAFHAEHAVQLHRPIPPQGRMVTETTVTEVSHRPAGVFVRLRSTTRDGSGNPLCDNEYLFIEVPQVRPYRPKQGEAGGRSAIGAGAGDFSASFSIPASQAALYRLSGDDNPLHIDPEFARRAGFDRPILHGLCTFGHATRALVAGCCGGNPTRLLRIGVRFIAPVFPGDTLTIAARRDGNERLAFDAHTQDGPVLSHGTAVVVAR